MNKRKGKIVACILGYALGLGDIPDEWIECLELKDEIDKAFGRAFGITT